MTISKSSTSRRQVGGDHYLTVAVQPWDAMQAWLSPAEFRGYLRGNAIKYLSRCSRKGGIEDLKKASHYTDKLIEVSIAEDVSVAEQDLTRSSTKE